MRRARDGQVEDEYAAAVQVAIQREYEEGLPEEQDDEQRSGDEEDDDDSQDQDEDAEDEEYDDDEEEEEEEEEAEGDEEQSVADSQGSAEAGRSASASPDRGRGPAPAQNDNQDDGGDDFDYVDDDELTPDEDEEAEDAYPASSSSAPSLLSAAAPPSSFPPSSLSAGPLSFKVGQSDSSSSSSSAAPFTFGSSSAPASFSFPAAVSTSSAGSASTSSSSSFANSQPAVAFAFSSAIPGPSSASSAASVAAPAAPAAPFAAPSTSAASSSAIALSPTWSSISVPLPVQGVSSVWGHGDELFLYGDAAMNKGAPAPRNDQALPFHGSDVARFQWPAVYGETGVLLHSWHAVFINVQQQARVQPRQGQKKAAAPGSGSALSALEWRTFLLSQSHCYRAELDACLYRAAQSLNSLSTKRELARYGVSTDDYHAHLLLLESAASIWHLFELVCLDPHDNLTVQLVDWLQRSLPAPQLHGLQLDSDEWWTALLQLLVQGRLETALGLLEQAAGVFTFLPSSALSQLVELVRALPSLTGAHASSAQHLISLVRDYQLAVQQLAASTAAFQSHPFLPVLLSVLAGDELALLALCDDWMQLLVAQLIFVQPHTSKQDLPDLVQRCVQAMDVKENEESREDAARQGMPVPLLSQLRQHILCFRVHSAVLLADQMFELPFFTAHLVDLLHLARLMPSLTQTTHSEQRGHKQKPATQPTEEMTPRDWYVWQYVVSIQQQHRLWTLVPDYVQSMGSATVPQASAPGLRASPVSPIHALCSLLLSAPCLTSSHLVQLLSLCSAHQLPQFVSEGLCLRFAQWMLREGQTGSAAYWFERGGESGRSRIQQVATRLLDQLILPSQAARDSVEESEAAMDALLDNVSAHWVNEESGAVELILLQQWKEYARLRRQLHEQPRARNHHAHMEPPTSSGNIFQSGRSVFPSAHAADDGMLDDAGSSINGSADDDRVAVAQSAIALLIALLTEPLVSSPRGALQYTPQSLHLPLLHELTALLRSLDVATLSSMGECSAASLQSVLNALQRCELSWAWEEWKRRAALDDEDVQSMRRVLLRCLQASLLIEERAKRVHVRV